MASEGLVPELYVSDFARSIEFYVNQAGFSILYQRTEDKFAYLVRETTRLMIEELGASREWITGEISYPFGRGVNFQISVQDAKKLHDDLTNAGHKIYLALEDKWYRKDDHFVGNRQFMVQDPDGYLLRFAEDLGVKHGDAA